MPELSPHPNHAALSMTDLKAVNTNRGRTTSRTPTLNRRLSRAVHLGRDISGMVQRWKVSHALAKPWMVLLRACLSCGDKTDCPSKHPNDDMTGKTSWYLQPEPNARRKARQATPKRAHTQ